MNSNFKKLISSSLVTQLPSALLLHLLVLLCFSCANEINLNQNNLNEESSAYLVQHAKNPVNWQRWDDDLYNRYNKEDRLLLVSIGYSSCHWCHVMEKETFEDMEVAQYMNENFISIKVDREENPEVDTIYMTATQMMTGSGGWPLNVVCLPDGRPVYGGTYHTKEQWLEVLGKIQKLYKKDKEQLKGFAEKIEKGIQEINQFDYSKEEKPFSPDLLVSEIALWSKNWDTLNGGEQVNQKFISPVKLNYIQQYDHLNKNEKTRDYLENTLTNIASSGIVDHLEGGFYRYTVDPQWKIPHFEKMLYDNAQLLTLYSNAFKKDKNPLYQATVYNTFRFLDQKMKSPQNAFFAAIDADNEDGEGRYYVFDKEELQKVAGEDLDLLLAYFQITLSEPFEESYYHLRKTKDLNTILKQFNVSLNDFNAKKTNWEDQFLKIRNSRQHPLTDTKIITSWNALVISGLLTAYEAFTDPIFLDQAVNTFRFIDNNLTSKGRLFHTFQDGKAVLEGNLEDYAFTVKAALELYKNTGDVFYLKKANGLTKIATDIFGTTENPFFTFTEDPVLFSELISVDDNVIPSANAIMAENLWTLGQFYDNKEYVQSAKNMLNAMVSYFSEGRGSDYSQWAQLLAKEAYSYKEVVLLGPQAKTMNSMIQQQFLPNVLFQISESESELPLLEDRFFEGETLIYVCENKVCLRPTKTVEEALIQIAN